MEYRTNRRTGDRISIIGIGSGSIHAAPEKEAVEALSYAYENGVNFMDLATAGASTFGYAAKAFSSVRGKMLIGNAAGESGIFLKRGTVRLKQINGMNPVMAD